MPTSTLSPQEQAKVAVGNAVAEVVEDGMVVGVGTGSTAARAIESIGRRIKQEGLRLRGVPTSLASERLARDVGIELVTLDEVESLDLAFDGADEVDPDLNLIKGRGAAHTREKVVATSARRFIVLVDESKIVDQLGTKMPVPIEVVPMATGPVMRLIESLGGCPVLRMATAKDGPVVSDQGLWIVDAHFSGISDPDTLDKTLSAQPGILDHGLFLALATNVLVGTNEGSVRAISSTRVAPTMS